MMSESEIPLGRVIKVLYLQIFGSVAVLLLSPVVVWAAFRWQETPEKSKRPVATMEQQEEMLAQFSQLPSELQGMVEESSRSLLTGTGQQKEAFEFLWTPGLMLRELLQDSPLVAYPGE
jgi:hypothetical protein